MNICSRSCPGDTAMTEPGYSASSRRAQVSRKETDNKPVNTHINTIISIGYARHRITRVSSVVKSISTWPEIWMSGDTGAETWQKNFPGRGNYKCKGPKQSWHAEGTERRQMRMERSELRGRPRRWGQMGCCNQLMKNVPAWEGLWIWSQVWRNIMVTSALYIEVIWRKLTLFYFSINKLPTSRGSIHKITQKKHISKRPGGYMLQLGKFNLGLPWNEEFI